MSLSSTLTEVINNIVKQFISELATKYSLDENELQNLWDKENTKKINLSEKAKSTNIKLTVDSVVDKKESDIFELSKCNKNELIAMCKTYGHKCSGTKDILITRLLGKNGIDTKKSDTQPSKPVNNKANKSKADEVKVENTPIVKKLTANIPNILIRRNQFNNYEHAETGLIFDNNTKIIIGKQKNDGSIEDLTEDDIDKCNAFKFKYILPKNLDNKSNLADVKVAELAEDEDDDEDDDEDENELEIDDESEVHEEELEEELLEEELLEEELLDDDDIDCDEEEEEEEDYE